MALSRAIGALQAVARGAGDQDDQLYNRGDIAICGNSQFEITSFIAKGGYASVFKARSLPLAGSVVVAVKVMLAQTNDALADIKKENRILLKVNEMSNDYMTRLLAQAASERRPGVIEYRLVLEYGKWSMSTLITKYRQLLTTDVLYRVFFQTAFALNTLHEEGITHRDVKTENVLLTESGLVKLCDFGSATEKTVDPSQLTYENRINAQEEIYKYTTPITRSPEIVNFTAMTPQQVNTKQDIWAFGCFMYQMCFNDHAFDGSVLAIANGKFKNFERKEENELNFISIITSCFTVSVEKRLSASELLREMKLLEAKFGSPREKLADLVINLNQLEVQERESVELSSTLDTLGRVKSVISDTITRFRPQVSSLLTNFGARNPEGFLLRQLIDGLFMAFPYNDSFNCHQEAMQRLAQWAQAEAQVLILNFSTIPFEAVPPVRVTNVYAEAYPNIHVYEEVVNYLQKEVPSELKVVVFGKRGHSTTAAKILLMAAKAVRNAEAHVESQVPAHVKRVDPKFRAFLRCWATFFLDLPCISLEEVVPRTLNLQRLFIDLIPPFKYDYAWIRVKGYKEKYTKEFALDPDRTTTTLVFDMTPCAIRHEGLISVTFRDTDGFVSRVADLYINTLFCSQDGTFQTMVHPRCISGIKLLEKARYYILYEAKQDPVLPVNFCRLDRFNRTSTSVDSGAVQTNWIAKPQIGEFLNQSPVEPSLDMSAISYEWDYYATIKEVGMDISHDKKYRPMPMMSPEKFMKPYEAQIEFPMPVTPISPMTQLPGTSADPEWPGQPSVGRKPRPAVSLDEDWPDFDYVAPTKKPEYEMNSWVLWPDDEPRTRRSEDDKSIDDDPVKEAGGGIMEVRPVVNGTNNISADLIDFS